MRQTMQAGQRARQLTMQRARRACLRYGLLLGLLLGGGPALPLATDSAQPTEIQADHAQLDDRTRIAIYTGKVEVNKGSMHMQGDRLTVHYDDHNQLKQAFMVGRPARFRQQSDQGEEIQGEALEFEYYVDRGLMHLIKAAKVTKNGGVVEGPYLSYDTQRGLYTGYRYNPAEGTSASTPKAGRIHQLIAPPKAGAAGAVPGMGIPRRISAPGSPGATTPAAPISSGPIPATPAHGTPAPPPPGKLPAPSSQ
jgi:lipopolysaccharide export system protein LptA